MLKSAPEAVWSALVQWRLTLQISQQNLWFSKRLTSDRRWMRLIFASDKAVADNTPLTFL